MSKRTFQLLLATCLLTGTLWAVDDSFTGKWKLVPAKSRLTDQMRVEAVGGNKYGLNFSGDNVEMIVADGTDQPGLFGTTMAITIEGPRNWKVVRKKDGHMNISAEWTLSEDGSTLTDNFTGYRPNGSTFNLLYVYKRTAGGSGFAGTWESVSEERSSAYEIQIEPYEGDGLAFINAAAEMTRNLKFDGKDYPNSGKSAVAGTTTSGERVDDRTLKLTDKINGKVLDTQQVEVSSDAKTLTMTLNIPGRSKPNILVFDRE
jgi:hypothetical protein